MGRPHVRRPIAHGFTNGIFEGPAAGIDTGHFRAK